jgi:YD repeat-containing protein
MSVTTNVVNRPVGVLDAQGRVIPASFGDLAFRGDYTGTDLIYKGFARPGSATSDDVWQIAKMSYDGSHNLLTITWPQNALAKASSDFQFEWDDRATYTYS